MVFEEFENFPFDVFNLKKQLIKMDVWYMVIYKHPPVGMFSYTASRDE